MKSYPLCLLAMPLMIPQGLIAVSPPPGWALYDSRGRVVGSADAPTATSGPPARRVVASAVAPLGSARPPERRPDRSIHPAPTHRIRRTLTLLLGGFGFGWVIGHQICKLYDILSDQKHLYLKTLKRCGLDESQLTKAQRGFLYTLCHPNISLDHVSGWLHYPLYKKDLHELRDPALVPIFAQALFKAQPTKQQLDEFNSLLIKAARS